MKLFGIFLTACVVLAAAQAAAAVVAVLILAGLVYGLFVAPRETFGFIGLLVLAGLLNAQPLAFLGLVALLIVAGMLRRA